VALGQVFSEYFGFPCQSSFHQLLHNHHLSSGAGAIGQQWPTYQVDSVSPRETKKLVLVGVLGQVPARRKVSVCIGEYKQRENTGMQTGPE
jgi:hypothetical protein